MNRLTDFEILRKEHDILAKKLNRLQADFELIGESQVVVTKLLIKNNEKAFDAKFIFDHIIGKLDRMEEGLRNGAENVHEKLDRIEKNQARIEKLLEEIGVVL